MAKKIKSIEEQVEDWCKKQFKHQKYYTKTDTINPEIASALEQAPSKMGGPGYNYPDIKCMLLAEERIFYMLYSYRENLQNSELKRCIKNDTFGSLLGGKKSSMNHVLKQSYTELLDVSEFHL